MSQFQSILIALFFAFSSLTVSSLNRRQIRIACRTIPVDPSGGGGSFRTIQSAIDSVPPYNQNWICININEGVYRERVYIPYGKSFIYLIGAGERRTYVVSDGTDPVAAATFTSQGDNIIAESISFNNSYNYPPIGSGNPMRPAVAAKIEGDKSAFYNVGFFGLQDTLWDVLGRHYFKSCTIEGAVDFIFGSGQSVYEQCLISVVASALRGAPGYITAQGRQDPKETNGFMFRHCTIIGDGPTYLGRPWRAYARVIFYNTFMSEIVVPKGWEAWYNTGGKEGQLTFIEIGSRGGGANTLGRVGWASKQQLSMRRLRRLINISFINGGDWLMKL